MGAGNPPPGKFSDIGVRKSHLRHFLAPNSTIWPAKTQANVWAPPTPMLPTSVTCNESENVRSCGDVVEIWDKCRIYLMPTIELLEWYLANVFYFIAGCPALDSLPGCGLEPEDTCTSNAQCSSNQRCCQAHQCRTTRRCTDVIISKCKSVDRNFTVLWLLHGRYACTNSVVGKSEVKMVRPRSNV
jgi:hypothetical protein